MKFLSCGGSKNIGEFVVIAASLKQPSLWNEIQGFFRNNLVILRHLS